MTVCHHLEDSEITKPRAHSQTPRLDLNHPLLNPYADLVDPLLNAFAVFLFRPGVILEGRRQEFLHVRLEELGIELGPWRSSVRARWGRRT